MAHGAMMQERKSRVASATSSPTPKATWSGSSCTKPTFRTAMAPRASLLRSARSPWLRHLFAEGGYAGEKLRTALKPIGEWTIEIIKRSDMAQGFEVLPRRWVVERTFTWLGRCHRLAKDFKATIASAVAWAFVAHIRTLTRRLARA